MKAHLGLALILALTAHAGANEIYNKIAPSTVLIMVGPIHGSGVLIDVKERLVVTNEHVVRPAIRSGSKTVKAVFPQRDAKSKIITNGLLYKKKSDSFAITGEIVYSNPGKDLALVKLSEIPDGARALPLASEDPSPGDPVHVVGNSTFADGGAFGYSTGTVRNQYPFVRPDFFYGGSAAFPVKTKSFLTLAHHAPANRGDSGGPVVNSQGELIGINCMIALGRDQVLGHSIHVAEIIRAMKSLGSIQQPSGKSFTFEGTVDSIGLDSFVLPVKKGDTIQAELKGNRATDLDLFFKDMDQLGQLDPKNNLVDYRRVIAKIGDSDQESGKAVIDWEGHGLLQVFNLPDNPKAAKVITPINIYTLEASWKTKTTGPVTVIRRIADQGKDVLKFEYMKDAGQARLQIRGDGDTDLEVIVTDPDGNEAARANPQEETQTLLWTPKTTGTYTVTIRNLGKIWNEYILSTD